MSIELKQREQDMEAEALRVNAGRKPKFGDLMRNPWAGESNPQRDGYFVRSKWTTGRMNPGLWYEFTDRNGEFWETGGKFAMFIDDRAVPAPTSEPLNVLALFLGAAYPVSIEIDVRGYRWSEAYLDQAREAALDTPAAPLPRQAAVRDRTRLIPDSECVQGKCGNCTTGCWDACRLRNPGFVVAPTAPKD